jgi:hypothetical protein
MQKRRQKIAAREQEKFAEKSVAETFSEIYKNNVWGGKSGEFFSGEGSRGKYAKVYAETVKNFIAENDIEKVVDLGCGDFQVASMFVSDDFHYTGCDVVPDLIEHLNKNFGSEKRNFRQANIVEDKLPEGDLCLIRQVLQHLSNAEIERILENCKKFRYLIITEHYPNPNVELVPNLDIPHGPDMRLHYDSAVVLDKPPFNLQNVKLLVETEADDDTRIKTFLITQ